jgi:Ulp1 family protease
MYSVFQVDSQRNSQINISSQSIVEYRIDCYKITRREISIIEAGEWLTDEIIQAYLFAISKPKKNHIIQSKVIADIITGKEVNIYKKNFSFCKFET